MRHLLTAVAGSLALAVMLPAGANAQRVHEIRLETNPARELYRFVPAQTTARPGDVLVFRTVSGTPHSIVFEAAGISRSAHEALNGAMARRASDLSSPLLTPDGAQYRIVVPSLSPGRYSFFCLPHRAYDMRGTIVVTK